MIEELQAEVRGRVQMVMYRDFVQRSANKLGLTGTVQNLGNGSVRVVAQGSKEQLEKLLVRLRRGSLLSRVDSVGEVWRKPSATYTGFSILI